jgi:shikimate dehydrogenase
MQPPPRYAVFGQPIGHSRSPAIHALFAAQFGQTIDYQRIEAAPGTLAAALRRFRDEGGVGCNITLPLKEEAAALADERSPAVAASGAANTLELHDDARIVAHNTDGIGLVTDLRSNCGAALEGAHVLVLGAGGAAAGVLQPLIEAGCARLVIANRKAERASALAERMRPFAAASGCALHACALASVAEPSGPSGDAIGGKPFTLVVQATSAGLDAQLVAPARAWLADDALCYDMLYAPGQSTPFTCWARAQGLAAADGLGMLVEQAACAYAIWRGHRPATRPVIDAVRRMIDAAAGA